MIKINNLVKYYGKHRGVDDISIHVEKGSIYGFIGQNGAGKSTTIKAMLNLIFPTSGSILIDNLDSINDSKEIKTFTSYVPSEVNYYEDLKVGDFLRYTMKLNDQSNVEKIVELCKYFDLDETRIIKELSLGNKKKVSIVQTLLKKPKVILLDEPTSGLDPVIQERLFKKLIELKKEGLTVFLSSHNLHEVEKYCDKVCIIKEGKVVFLSDTESMKSSRKLKVSYELKSGEKVEELYEGEVSDLLKSLSQKDILHIEIKYTTLEEAFMKYYSEV